MEFRSAGCHPRGNALHTPLLILWNVGIGQNDLRSGAKAAFSKTTTGLIKTAFKIAILR